MNNYIIIIRVIFILILLSNCSFLDKKEYSISYLEETCLNHNDVKKKYIGMTRDQIIYIFGIPVISDSFDDAYHYIICKKKDNNVFEKKILNLYFKDNKVVKFDIK